MNIVARIKFSDKLKVSTSTIGYYSYTNRYLQAENPIAQSSTFHFFVPQKIKRACLFPTLTQNKNQN